MAGKDDLNVNSADGPALAEGGGEEGDEPFEEFVEAPGPEAVEEAGGRAAADGG